MEQIPLNQQRYPIDKAYEFVEQIGNGSFGIVWKAIHIQSKQLVAIKQIPIKNFKDFQLQMLQQEVQILESLKDQNIVEFKQAFQNQYNIFIVMEYIKDGTLKQFIEYRTNGMLYITDLEASHIMKQILSAVNYIHLKNIIHRDIKPENVLVNDFQNIQSIKLNDFGLSTQFSVDQPSRFFNEKCGTQTYMAPEFMNDQQYSKPVDIWSCGIIMFQLLSGGKHPLYRKNDDVKTREQKLTKLKWKFPSNFTDLSINFFEKLMQYQPSQRYTAIQALKHPWITRNYNEGIPLTFQQDVELFEKQLMLSYITRIIYFFEYCKKICVDQNLIFKIDYKTQDNIDLMRSAQIFSRDFLIKEQAKLHDQQINDQISKYSSQKMDLRNMQKNKKNVDFTLQFQDKIQVSIDLINTDKKIEEPKQKFKFRQQSPNNRKQSPVMKQQSPLRQSASPQNEQVIKFKTRWMSPLIQKDDALKPFDTQKYDRFFKRIENQQSNLPQEKQKKMTFRKSSKDSITNQTQQRSASCDDQNKTITPKEDDIITKEQITNNYRSDKQQLKNFIIKKSYIRQSMSLPKKDDHQQISQQIKQFVQNQNEQFNISLKLKHEKLQQKYFSSHSEIENIQNQTKSTDSSPFQAKFFKQQADYRLNQTIQLKSNENQKIFKVYEEKEEISKFPQIQSKYTK